MPESETNNASQVEVPSQSKVLKASSGWVVRTEAPTAEEKSAHTQQSKLSKILNRTKRVTLIISLIIIILSIWIVPLIKDAQQKAALGRLHSKIAFESFRNGNNEIYVMNADGSNQVNLSNNSMADTEPTWSPDGKYIAFVSDRNSNDEIYAMNADGSNQVNLTSNSASDVDPAWSPDGKYIAFASNRGSGYYEIYVMNADGSNQVNLTNSATSDWKNPTWSPDGKHIAFSSGRDIGDEIYTISTDGSNMVKLTNLGGRPALSTTGKYIAMAGQPAWSPDGKHIAFISFPDATYEIYIMNADGSNSINLTTNIRGELEPAWSPDGKYIAFADDNGEIYAMNADGSNQINLTNIPAMDWNPDWSPQLGTSQGSE